MGFGVVGLVALWCFAVGFDLRVWYGGFYLFCVLIYTSVIVLNLLGFVAGLFWFCGFLVVASVLVVVACGFLCRFSLFVVGCYGLRCLIVICVRLRGFLFALLLWVVV